MRKILIPTDFSENSMNATRYALELFKYDKSEIFIVHAYADEVYEDKAIKARARFEEVKEEKKQQTERSFETFLAKIKEFAPNPKHQIIPKAVFGSLVDVVNDLVEAENMDIVAMGTQGASHSKEVTFGSQTLQVIRYVKSPVLAVPCCFTEIDLKSLVLATDYQVPYQKRELKLLSCLAKNFAAKLTLLYVSKFEKLSIRQEDHKAFLENSLEPCRYESIHVSGKNISETIHEFINANQVDMLVMVNSRHSYLENLLQTSKIETFGLGTQIPFLVLQNLSR